MSALRPGERVLFATQTDRVVQLLSFCLYTVLGLMAAVVAQAVLFSPSSDGNIIKTGIQFALSFGPLLIGAMLRSRPRYLLTTHRIAQVSKTGQIDSQLLLHDLKNVRRFQGSLFLTGRKSSGLKIQFVREALLIEQTLRQRLAA